MDRLVLGVDCGLTAPGAAVVRLDARLHPRDLVVASCLQTKGLPAAARRQGGQTVIYKSADDARRVVEISDWLAALVADHDPDLAVLELPSSGGKSATAVKGMLMGAATAVVTLRRMGYAPGENLFFVTPRQNKAGSTTDPTAEKAAVLAGVQAAFPAYQAWPRMRSKRCADRLDLVQCWAMADAVSTVLAWRQSVTARDLPRPGTPARS